MLANETYALVAGGLDASYTFIDSFTIATPSNATDFGDLLGYQSGPAACSDGTKGLWAGGANGGGFMNDITYVTIATPGNSTDFGDLTVARSYFPGLSGD